MSKIMKQIQMVINSAQVYEKRNQSSEIIQQNKFNLLKNIEELITLASINWQETDKTTKRLILETLQYINKQSLLSMIDISAKNRMEASTLLENIKNNYPKLVIKNEPKPSLNQFIIESNILKFYKDFKSQTTLEWEKLYTSEYELYCDMRDVILNKIKEDIKHIYLYAIAKTIYENLDNIDYNKENPTTKQFLDIINLILKHPKSKEYNKKIRRTTEKNLEILKEKVKKKQGQIL